MDHIPHRHSTIRRDLRPDRCVVFRGGSWKDWSGNCRAASRNKATPDCRANFIGFRVVMTITQNTPATRQGDTDATNGRGTRARREVPWMPDEEPRSFCVTIIVTGLAFAGEQARRLTS